MADFGGMSAAQINAGMGFGPGGVGDQSQALLNNNFGNFGQQTDYYSGLGAAYGRGVGEPSGMGSVFDPSAYGMPAAQPFQSYGQPALPSGGGSGLSDAYWMATIGYVPDRGTGSGAPTNATPSPQGLLGYTPTAPGAALPNGFGYPGATPPSQMFNPNTFVPSQQQSSSGGGVPAGMSASDWATFSRAVGADAANAWAAQQGGGAMPVGMDYSSRGPAEMNAQQFQNLPQLQNPQLNFPMPQISNDFYTSTNPGFGSSNRFNMQTTQPPAPIQGSSGIPRFGGGDYSVIPPYGGEGDQDTIDNRGAGGRPSWMNPNPGS